MSKQKNDKNNFIILDIARHASLIAPSLAANLGDFQSRKKRILCSCWKAFVNIIWAAVFEDCERSDTQGRGGGAQTEDNNRF